MKIYTMDAIFENGDTVYREARPHGYSNWFQEAEDQISKGEPLQMAWPEDSLQKPISNFILFPFNGIAGESVFIERLLTFSPSAKLVRFSINKNDNYLLLRPKNYLSTDTPKDHIFLCWKKHKRLLVTQIFKDFWQANRWTGAVFNLVDEFNDSDFNDKIKGFSSSNGSNVS